MILFFFFPPFTSADGRPVPSNLPARRSGSAGRAVGGTACGLIDDYGSLRKSPRHHEGVFSKTPSGIRENSGSGQGNACARRPSQCLDTASHSGFGAVRKGEKQINKSKMGLRGPLRVQGGSDLR